MTRNKASEPAKPSPGSEAVRLFEEALTLHRSRRLAEALAMYDKTIALMPDNAVVYSNRGIVLQGLSHFAEALASYDKAIALKPGYADAHSNRGNALQDLKRFEEAVASYDTAIALKPDHADARNNRGNALRELQRFGEALASYDAAIAFKPDYAEAFSNRGSVLRELKRPEEALVSYEAAIALKPDRAEAFNIRGNLLQDLKRFEEALASYDKAIALKPDYADAFSNRSNALQALRRYEEALASCDRALALNPSHTDAFCNRGNALQELKRFDDSIASYNQALALKPDHADILNNRGNANLELKRFDEAIADYEKAIALRPGLADAFKNKGLVNLLLGRFAEGWPDQEWRWKAKDVASKQPELEAKEWQGEDLKGRSIFVYMEQGFGDTMQFARYLPLLVKRGTKVTISASRKIFRLLRPLCEGIEVTEAVPKLQSFDFQCALMSLPLHFRTDLSSIPADIPYLHAEDGPAAQWKKRLGSDGFKVGIVWQGNPFGVVDRGRSIPLREFFPLARINGVRLISLQKNHGLDQLGEVPSDIEIETLGDDFDSGPDAFIDTAAVMANLDLVISSDTSTAHLAGALGRPLWVALKYVPDWRWLLDREDSPWYPTARLFRQDRMGEWTALFSRMEREISSLVQGKGALPSKVSRPAKPRPESEAVRHFQEALRLHRVRRFDEALASYDAAIAINPRFADAHNNRGDALCALNRLEEALESYNNAIAIKPDGPTFNNRGNTLQDLNRYEEAVASYDAAIALMPGQADIYNNRGNTLLKQKQFEAALKSYDAAIARDPAHAEAFNNRGNVLVQLKRFDEALASCERALALRPGYANAHINRGNVLHELHRYEEAVASYDAALALNSDHASAYSNHGNALRILKRFDEALASCDAAIALKPGHADAHHNRSFVLRDMKRLEEALVSCDAALALKPDFPEASCNRGMLNLLLGRFSEGWPDHEWRWAVKDGAGKKPWLMLAAPEWRGEDLKGRRIFVYAEQGLGDIMQFARYLPLLVKRGAKVTFAANHKILRLLRLLCKGIEVVDSVPSKQTFDFQCALMSLPLHFRTVLSTIPADIPYLHAEDGLVAKWKDRLGKQGFKIGIVWQGSPSGTVDRGRSFPLREFSPLARIKGVRLISLQKNYGLDQLAEIPPDIEIETLGEDFDSGPDAFLDTAAVMANLDLVISSDTSTAHLAGALGRPLWVALKYVPDWRWLLDREDSPWYPTARLFRQERAGDWKGVFSRMERELKSLVREKSPRPQKGSRAAQPRPDFDSARLFQEALALHQSRRFAEALASYDKVIVLMPGHGIAYSNRGVVLQELARFTEALASYDTAIALMPGRADIHNNRGNVLQLQKRFEAALASYDAAIALKPDYAEAFNNRSNTLRALKRCEEALESCDKAISLKPLYPEAFNNRGLALHDLGRLVEALKSFDKAISLKPDYADAFVNRGGTLCDLKRFEEALACAGKALVLKPGHARAINFRSGIELLLGRFAEGWADHEWRWKVKECTSRKPALAAPEWQGEDLKGRSILIYMEQGLGDTMQFARYLPLLVKRGAKVTFSASRNLHRLLRPLGEGIETVGAIKPSHKFDFQCALMSLPLHFRTDLSSIPADIPYLHAEDGLAAKWKDRLGRKGFKIGIVWQGSPSGSVDRGRSVPLREFAPLAGIKDVRLISLQKNHGLDQLAELPEGIKIETLGDDFDTGPDAFLDTAAVMANLDLVISSDTSTAHLAGALGRPLWVALKYVPDWRWLLDREDSPWYPTARLFRQERAGDWKGVFSRMEAELRVLVRAGRRS
jgi:tetratricopeptide (TPR) repeat protein